MNFVRINHSMTGHRRSSVSIINRLEFSDFEYLDIGEGLTPTRELISQWLDLAVSSGILFMPF